MEHNQGDARIPLEVTGFKVLLARYWYPSGFLGGKQSVVVTERCPGLG